MKKTLLSLVFLLFTVLTFAQHGYGGEGCAREGGNRQDYYNNNSSSYYNRTVSSQKAPDVAYRVYPNPVVDFIQIDDESVEKGAIHQMNVFNITGQLVKTFKVAKGQSYDLSDLKVGTYLVQFLDWKDRKLATRRITKNNP